MKGDERVIVFSKIPQRGRVKTRLIPAIGEVQALLLYEAMIRHTLETVEKSGVPAQISYCGTGDPMKSFSGFRSSFSILSQKGTDLGERMANAFEEVFENAGERAVLIGCDIPQLTTELLRRAFDCLGSSDTVFGPADDGGYYLVGLNRNAFIPDLFTDIGWGSEWVLKQTLEKISAHGLSVEMLDQLLDVDTSQDLFRLQHMWRKNPPEDNPVYRFMEDLYLPEGVE